MSAGDVRGADAPLLDHCALVGCWAVIENHPGRGRRRRYCTDDHRREADTMRKRALARVEHLTALLDRERHLLAALGGDSHTPAADSGEGAS